MLYLSLKLFLSLSDGNQIKCTRYIHPDISVLLKKKEKTFYWRERSHKCLLILAVSLVSAHLLRDSGDFSSSISRAVMEKVTCSPSDEESPHHHVLIKIYWKFTNCLGSHLEDKCHYGAGSVCRDRSDKKTINVHLTARQTPRHPLNLSNCGLSECVCVCVHVVAVLPISTCNKEFRLVAGKKWARSFRPQ